ncbi:MAG: DUF2851 family protein [Elusimicrobiota bacterium]
MTLCVICVIGVQKMKYFDELKFHNPTSFTDQYRKLRDSVFIKEAEKPYTATAQPVTEKLVKTIWFDQKIERRGLITTDGQRLSIISPGEWNFDEGPDFKNAKININGQELSGDVEVDIYSSDWKAHGHYKNKQFNTVILHVFLWHKGSGGVRDGKGDKGDKGDKGIITNTITQNKKIVPTLELINCIDDDLEIIDNNFEIENYPYSSKVRAGKCANYTARKYTLLEHIIGLAGDEKIKLKSELLKLQLSDKSNSINDIIYNGIVDGLGYGPNRDNFRKLSEILPLKRIDEIIKLEKFEEKHLRVESLFFGIVGLIPEIEKIEMLDDEAKEYIQKIKKIWKVLRQNILPHEVMKKESWKFRGLRPYNFPYRRLAATALIVSEYIDTGFEQVFQHFCTDILSNKLNLKKFLEKLKPAIPSFWSYRTTFTSKKLTKPVALIGEERFLLILINTFLPLALAVYQKPDEQKSIYQWWLKQPAISINRLARITSWRVGFGSFRKRNERIQQGLLQIFRDFCDTKKGICTNCSFQSIFSIPAGTFF